MTPGVEKLRSYTIEADEKISPVMVYTQTMLFLGDVVTKKAIRVSTWLRSNAAPKYINMNDVQVMNFSGAGMPKPQHLKTVLLPTHQVIAFHLRPPTQEPLDFDPTETNRKMEPVSALIGPFRADGSIRMAVQTTLARYLDVAKETYSSMYDVELSHPMLPAMGVIKTPFLLINNELVVLSLRQS
jgi:hypothetical protein